MFYLVKTPWWVKKWIYPNYLWSMPRNQKKIYLTFDDGPHPLATAFVLDALKKYNAAATFFCIGKNVVAHPEIYKQILLDGHATGNHTNDHLNGWKTEDKIYIENIIQAAKYIDSKLFRPPYGHISGFQAKLAAEKMDFKIVMWSVLSADFDIAITPQKCWRNVKRSAGNGSVIVFHDSEKAMERMQYALTETLEYFSKKGFVFEKLPG
ncbi:MAG TPA: polysaccharide deacetylase family protein [Chitinophagaceae bacterium]|jgi:peptidoglycan-N-acetylglucosamine deacetylase|nr:polysaccharide deacetylase family protein [Chitinophagaceae bacterium]